MPQPQWFDHHCVAPVRGRTGAARGVFGNARPRAAHTAQAVQAGDARSAWCSRPEIHWLERLLLPILVLARQDRRRHVSDAEGDERGRSSQRDVPITRIKTASRPRAAPEPPGGKSGGTLVPERLPQPSGRSPRAVSHRARPPPGPSLASARGALDRRTQRPARTRTRTRTRDNTNHDHRASPGARRDHDLSTTDGDLVVDRQLVKSRSIPASAALHGRAVIGRGLA
jgi:hypothetical protein